MLTTQGWLERSIGGSYWSKVRGERRQWVIWVTRIMRAARLERNVVLGFLDASGVRMQIRPDTSIAFRFGRKMYFELDRQMVDYVKRQNYLDIMPFDAETVGKDEARKRLARYAKFEHIYITTLAEQLAKFL